MVVALGCFLLDMDIKELIQFVKVTHNNDESIEASLKLFNYLKYGKELDTLKTVYQQQRFMYRFINFIV